MASIQEGRDFLINECYIPSYMLDNAGDCTGGWRIGVKNGPLAI